jgi:signal transduction histidine kinase
MALLVAVALLVAQAVNFGLQLSASQRQRTAQTTAVAVARLAEAVARAESDRSIAAAPRIETAANPITPTMTRRDDVAARARQTLDELGLAARNIAAAEAMGREYRYVRDPVTNALRRIDGPKSNALLLTAEISEGRWVTAVAQFPRQDYSVVLWLLFQTVLLYGFIVLPVVWFVWRLSRPLRNLRTAVEGFTSAAPAPPVIEEGPNDIRRLVAAFNTMRSRLIAMLDEKDRMLGAIGHDLRTPLASLRVRTELVDDEAERDRMAATIDEMNRTLDDILSLARLGRPSEPASRVDLPALVDSVVEDFHDLGADVTTEEGDRLTVTMRPTLVRRAVRNLIENAIKYGGTARARVRPENGGAVVEIDDDGPGIPPGEIERMFEPFTRAENSRSRETGGAGLGLALARAIATQHDGSLTLENRPEGGLRATLWLPLV